MQNVVFLLAALSATDSALTRDSFLIAPPPNWVMPVSAPKSDSAKVTTASVETLLVDQQVNFEQDADSIYQESVVRISNAQGLAPVGNFQLSWKPDTERLTIHKFQIIRGPKIIDVLDKGPAFTILRREDNLEYATLDGALTATLQPEGLQVGDIVDVAYTLRRHDPVLDGHSDHILLSRFSSPVGRVNISARWPTEKSFKTRSIDPPVVPVETAGRYRLDATNIEPPVGPKGAPARFWNGGQVEFSDFASWADVGAIFAPLYDEARMLPPNSPLNEEIARIRRESNDPVRQVEGALALVQNQLRYVFLGMNQGHLRPASADVSWQRRFADCKGKTALLLALLDGLKIEAQPALVSIARGDGLDERLPAVGAFDHVIVRAMINNRVYWLDGTRNGDTSLARLKVPPFGWALPLKRAGAALERLVVPPLVEPQEVIQLHLDTSTRLDQPAMAKAEATFAGDGAVDVRTRLANLSPAERDRTLRDYWKGQFDFITPETVSAHYDEAKGLETIAMTGVAKLEWNVEYARPYYEISGSRLGWRPDFTRDVGMRADAPFAVAYPGHWVRRQTIVLPKAQAGFSIDGKDVDLSVAGYRFKRTTRIDGNILTMEASTQALVPEISATEAAKATGPMRELSRRPIFVEAPAALAASLSAPSGVPGPDWKRATGAKAHWVKAVQLVSSGKPEEAMAEAGEATRLDPGLIDAYEIRARIYLSQRQLPKAGAEADALIKASPANARAHRIAGAILCGAGRAADGLSVLEKAQLLEPKIENLVSHARCRSKDDLAGKRSDIEQALKVDPNAIDALSARSEIQHDMGDAKGEFETLTRLAALQKDNLMASARLAGAFARSGHAAEARAQFADVRAKAAENAILQNELCWQAASAGLDLELALKDCSAAVDKKPQNAQFQDSLGFVLLRLGRDRESIAAYDIALKFAPQTASAYYGRGLARQRAGDTAEAAADLKAARSFQPNIDTVFEAYGMRPLRQIEASFPPS